MISHGETIILYIILSYSSMNIEAIQTCDTIDNCLCKTEDTRHGTRANCSKLDITTVPKGNRNIGIMDLRDNQITRLDKNSFTTVPFLQKVDLSNNNITFIDKDTFRSTPYLAILELKYNYISNLSEETLVGNQRLLSIKLYHNKIVRIPEEIFRNNYNLEFIDLGKNKLTRVPENIFVKTTKLHTLSVANNHLRSLPPLLFKGLNALKILGISGNLITELHPGMFDSLHNLEQLLIGAIPITEFPHKIFDKLENLKYMVLTNMQELLAYKDGIFDSLGHLEELFMDNNELRDLPVGIFDKLFKLQALDLHHSAVNWKKGVFDNLENLAVITLDWFIDNDCILYPWVVKALAAGIIVQFVEKNQVVPVRLFRSQNGKRITQTHKTEILKVTERWLQAMKFCKAIKSSESTATETHTSVDTETPESIALTTPESTAKTQKSITKEIPKSKTMTIQESKTMTIQESTTTTQQSVGTEKPESIAMTIPESTAKTQELVKTTPVSEETTNPTIHHATFYEEKTKDEKVQPTHEGIAVVSTAAVAGVAIFIGGIYIMMNRRNIKKIKKKETSDADRTKEANRNKISYDSDYETTFEKAPKELCLNIPPLIYGFVIVEST